MVKFDKLNYTQYNNPNNGISMKTYKSKPDAVVDLLAIVTKTANEYFGIVKQLNFSDSIDEVITAYGADSIDTLEFLMEIEDILEVEVDEDIFESSSTIGAFIDYLVAQVKIEEPKKVAPTLADLKKAFNDVENGTINITSAGPVTISASSLTIDKTPSKLTSAPTANDAVGILWMPSLEWHGRIFKIEGVTMAEAIEHMNDFAVKASKKRKTKEFKLVDVNYQHSEFFVNVIDTDSFPQAVLDDPRYFNKDVMSMMESMVPQTRGLRPLFLAHNVIGIGTTVIYNKNWATLHFEDHTAMNRLLQIQEKYEAKDDGEDDSYEDSDEESDDY
jgi:acyl carrier protein